MGAATQGPTLRGDDRCCSRPIHWPMVEEEEEDRRRLGSAGGVGTAAYAHAPPTPHC